jgi:hypothetical protein
MECLLQIQCFNASHIVENGKTENGHSTQEIGSSKEA